MEDRDLLVPSIDQENLKTTIGALSLATVPCSVECASTSQHCECLMRDTPMPDLHVSYHSETSTSCCVEAVAESSSRPVPAAEVVCTRNPRI